jgi:hypothetical protein
MQAEGQVLRRTIAVTGGETIHALFSLLNSLFREANSLLSPEQGILVKRLKYR